MTFLSTFNFDLVEGSNFNAQTKNKSIFHSFFTRQFLLDILTDKKHTDIIQWLSNSGEFKLAEPEKVAELWGNLKNNPTMNYAKLSRALRYYYDGQIISKVRGKKFVYQFVCDLKELVGYSAQQLSDIVNGRSRQPRPRRNPKSDSSHEIRLNKRV